MSIIMTITVENKIYYYYYYIKWDYRGDVRKYFKESKVV